MSRTRLARLALHARRAALVFGLIGGSTVVLHCGSSEDGSHFTDGDPCSGVYKGKCGGACTTDTECADGLYCKSGSCSADCAGGECSSGVACSPRGRCGDLGGDLPGESDNDGGITGCPGLEVSLAKVVPKVVFLLDQSSSMYRTKLPSGDSNNCTPSCRWTVLKDVLIGPSATPGGLLKELDGQAEIALELYSATDANPNDGDNSFLTGPTDNVCPRFNGKAFDGLTFDLNAYAGAEALLRPATVDDDTPTGPAIRTVVGMAEDGSIADQKGFGALSTSAPKLLVLVTDGEPALCGSNTPSDQGKAAVIKATQDAFTHDIHTLVIAIGDAVGAADHFNAVANAGQGLDPKTGSAKAILPDTPQALFDALKKAVLDARTCSFDLQGGEVAAGKEKEGTVTLNGAPVPYDDPGAPDEGWHLASPSRIELVGSACTTLKSTPDAVLSAHFPCGAIRPK